MIAFFAGCHYFTRAGWIPQPTDVKYQFVMLTWSKPASLCYHPRLASPDLASHSFDYFMKGNCRHQHGHQSDLDRLGWTNHCRFLSCLLSAAPREMQIDKRWKESRERSKLIHQHLGSGLRVKTVVARSHQVGRKVRSWSSMPPPSRALCTQPTQPARCKDERKEVQTLKLSLHVQESWLYDLQRVNKRPEGKGGGTSNHKGHVFAFLGLGTWKGLVLILAAENLVSPNHGLWVRLPLQKKQCNRFLSGPHVVTFEGWFFIFTNSGQGKKTIGLVSYWDWHWLVYNKESCFLLHSST